MVHIDTILDLDNTPVIQKGDIPNIDNNNLTRLIDLQNINEHILKGFTFRYIPIYLYWQYRATTTNKCNALAKICYHLVGFIETKFKDLIKSM
ncbi:MAG: hypothetical protein ACTS8R_02620 [Arsenophonus sp. NC-QC1-MAG3]